MTESEIQKLSTKDLILALNEKAVISNLRTNSDLLKHVIDKLDEKTLAESFVKNKFAPKAAVTQYPLSFIEQFDICNFNPGLDGILDLCQVSTSSKTDKCISNLISKFQSNKYDASFVRTIINIAAGEKGIVLENTIASLIAKTDVALILLEDLKNTNPILFFKTLMKQTGPLLKKGCELVNDSARDEFFSNNPKLDDSIEMINFLVKNEIPAFARIQDSMRQCCNKIMASAKADKLEDKVYIELVKVVAESAESKIEYRECFEHVRFPEHFGLTFKNVPKESIYYRESFVGGNVDMTAEEAYKMLPGGLISRKYQIRFYYSRRNQNHLGLQAVLGTGTDAEMASEIRKNPEIITEFLSRHSIKPAVLRDSIPRERSQVAAAIHAIVSSEYKKQIVSSFQELKKERTASSKVPIAELHSDVWQAISSANGEAFIKAITNYESGTFKENLNSFFDRQEQKTYKNAYTSSVSSNFFKSLDNEALSLELIDKGLKPYVNSNEQFVSAKNAILLIEKNIFDSSDAFEVTYEKEKFIDLLPQDELCRLNIITSDRKPEIKKAQKQSAARIAEIVRKHSGEKLTIRGDELEKAVAKLVSKEQFLKAVNYDILDGWSENYKIVFAEGEKLSEKDILGASNAKSNPDAVVDALLFIGETEKLKEICKAIISSKADDFKTWFPRARNRQSSLKDKAISILGSSGAEDVSTEDILKKSNNFFELKSLLGDGFIDKLLKKTSKRKSTLVFQEFFSSSTGKEKKSSFPTREELELLSTRYNLSVPNFYITGINSLNAMKRYIEAGATIGLMSFSNEASEKDNENIVKESITLARANGIQIAYRDKLFEFALIDGCSDILQGISTQDLQNQIKDSDSLLLAHKLDIPFSSSLEVAQRVANNTDMLNAMVKHDIRFDNLVVEVYNNNHPSLTDKAKDLGLLVLTREEFGRYEVYSKVFDSRGIIKDFQPLSIHELSMSDKVTLIKKLSEQNPKFKKLLGQDLESPQFILCPADQIDKSILNLSNIKDNLGFGMPGDLSKEEQGKLSDLITVRAPLISLAVQNIKKYFSLAGLSEVKFSDIFTKSNDGKMSISALATFMASSYQGVEGASLLFSSVLKSPSRAELLAFIKDGDDYDISYLRDAVRSFENVRGTINSFISVLGDSSIRASLIFDAIAGDNASVAILNDKMAAQTDSAELLRELSSLVMRITVDISIARKKAKAGEVSELSKKLHDLLGELEELVQTLTRRGGDAKKSKIKSGFDKYNTVLKNEFHIKDKAGGEYVLFFPESLAEVRSVGVQMKWCTKYNDHYFDDMIRGNAILFNLKQGDEIKAQGYVTTDGSGRWIMSQLKYYYNADAFNKFNHEDIIFILKELIRKDEALSERYSIGKK